MASVLQIHHDAIEKEFRIYKLHDDARCGRGRGRERQRQRRHERRHFHLIRAASTLRVVFSSVVVDFLLPYSCA